MVWKLAIHDITARGDRSAWRRPTFEPLTSHAPYAPDNHFWTLNSSIRHCSDSFSILNMARNNQQLQKADQVSQQQLAARQAQAQQLRQVEYHEAQASASAQVCCFQYRPRIYKNGGYEDSKELGNPDISLAIPHGHLSYALT